MSSSVFSLLSPFAGAVAGVSAGIALPAIWVGAMWRMWMPPRASMQCAASSGLVRFHHLEFFQCEQEQVLVC